MKQDFVVKTGLLCLTFILILLIWFGFRTIDQQAVQINSLTKEVNRKEDQLQFLKTNIRMKTNEVNETESVKIEESINVFVQSVLHVKEDQLEQRREKAKSVLTQELFKKIFPTEEEEKLLYEHEVSDSRIYVKNQDENGNAIVILEETMTTLANDQKESSRITIEVFLQKEGEKWVVNRFEQLDAEPI